jgi:hypothetical protein
MKEKKKFLSWQELQPLNGTQLYHDKQWERNRVNRWEAIV